MVSPTHPDTFQWKIRETPGILTPAGVPGTVSGLLLVSQLHICGSSGPFVSVEKRGVASVGSAGVGDPWRP